MCCAVNPRRLRTSPHRRKQRSSARASSGCCGTCRPTCPGRRSPASCQCRRTPSARTSAASTPSSVSVTAPRRCSARGSCGCSRALARVRPAVTGPPDRESPELGDGRSPCRPLTSALPGNRVTKGLTTVTISDSTVAIIGIGNIGSRLAANFAAGGQDFLLAGRDQDAAGKVAFGTLSAGSLSAAARQEPERAVLFYAADDAAAGDLVADLIRAGGYEPVRVGGLDQSIRLEVFGDLHEYGALGRVVTKSEALKAI